VKLLEQLPVHAPEIQKYIAIASEASEAISGEGESKVLQRVTVNIGSISGGKLSNLIPSEAQAQGDIRIPLGISIENVRKHLQEYLDPMGGVSWRIIRSYEPTCTSPSHPLIESALLASTQVMDQQPTPVVNIRVGASDARLYRATGIPSVVVGCTPYGMGAADEFIMIEELVKVAQIHALIAYDLLKEE
jgi:acetylornithine deacetylase/succinyl-diaminopimelate desuccinylase-like protein